MCACGVLLVIVAVVLALLARDTAQCAGGDRGGGVSEMFVHVFAHQQLVGRR